MMGAAGLFFLTLLSARTLTLEEAVRTAETNQPALHEAQANTRAGNARAEGARAPVLPQVKLGATYQRTTGNREHKPNSATTVENTADTFNWWDFTALGSFVLWDFGQTRGQWHAAEATARSLAETESATRLQVILDARTAYFRARAQKALVGVASESLANRDRHLGQIDGFVTEGTRPQIDLAQARADRSRARVELIDAQNAYSVARAALNQAMGVTGAIDYDVADQTFGPVDGEAQPVATLVDEALRARPDRAALDEQIHAEELSRRAAVGSYGPTLSLIAGASDRGANLTANTALGVTSSGSQRLYTAGLAWNFWGGLSLVWPIFQGFATRSAVREADAQLTGLQARKDALVQQVWVSVAAAQLDVRAAQEAIIASREGVQSSRERLALAEGRYQAGAGSVIELGDAQGGVVIAEAQQVAAEYRLAIARAQLIFALGRR
jgi:outer membrane protein